jgi:hypothetical protein
LQKERAAKTAPLTAARDAGVMSKITQGWCLKRKTMELHEHNQN